MDKTTETAIEEKTDRTHWAPGPWDGEPDRLEWRTAVGLPALARRGTMGQWCGYVAVPPGHPAHGREAEGIDVSVHGGLTYSSPCAGPVCHVPAAGEPADVYWIGFDCGHYQDRMPNMEAELRAMGLPESPINAIRGGDFAVYRTLAYVRAECESLAVQLAEMKTS